jgi:hypothetical protein
MKFCFKCGKSYPEENMKPKIDLRGRRIGSQCVNCIKNKSQSLIKSPAEAGGVYKTESQVTQKIQD